MLETVLRNVEERREQTTCPVCQALTEPTGEVLGGYPLYLCRACGVRCAPSAFQVRVNYDEVYAGELYPDQTVEAMRRQEMDGLDASRFDTYIPFFQHLKPSKDQNRLLDVGCGGGRFCRAAARRGWQTLGIDVSNVALQFAREVHPLDYCRIDLGDVPKSCGRFDAITAFEVVEHQSDIRDFLHKVLCALKDDGQFLCTVPAWDDPEVRNAVRLDWIPPVHLLFFTRSALRATLGANGFDVVDAGYIPGPPLPFWPRTAWLFKTTIRRTLGRWNPLGVWALARPRT